MLWNVTTAEYLRTGHMACPGCGASLSLRHALKVLGEQTIVVLPACCTSIIVGGQPTTAVSVPLLHVPFATAAACASGVRRALLAQGRREVTVMVWAGDGGTFDIGLQAISGAAERHEDFLYVCYDNEAYMNTGVQRSGCTPYGAMTTTSPPGSQSFGQMTWKKNVPAIAVAHGIPYVATASPAFFLDLMNKVKKAAMIKGPAYVHIFSPCPTGWGSKGEDSIKLARLAVDTKVFPLYEVIEGKYYITRKVTRPKPVEEYLKLQRRFRHLAPEQIEEIQRRVDADYERLLRLAEL